MNVPGDTVAESARRWINVEETGAGERLILAIHGWSGTSETFRPIAAYLPSGVRLLSIDLPGCGRSARPEEWSVEAIADAIAREIVSRASGPVELVGNCSGAIVGLVAAERHRGLFSRLVLIDPFAFMPWYLRVFLNPTVGRRAYMTTFANPVGRWIANRSLAARRADNSDLTASFVAVDHDATLRYLQLLGSIGTVGRFAGIDVPVEIVHGARTFGAIRRSVEMWRSLWPLARVHVIAEAGHLPIEESPGAVARIVFRPGIAT